MLFKRKFLKLALISVALLPIPVLAANQHQWVRITTDNFNNVWYLDKNIEKQGQYRFYYEKLQHAQSTPYWGLIREEWYYSIDCKSKQRRIRMYRGYNQQNQVRLVDDENDRAKVVRVPPNTPDSRIANQVCSR